MKFLLSSARAMRFVLFGLLITHSSTRGECYFLPPGGPMAFGLLEVARYNLATPAGDSPLWMDDGRIVIGSSTSSGSGSRKGAVHVTRPLTSRFANQSILYPQDPKVGIFGAFGLRMATSGSWLAVSAQRTNGQWTIAMLQATNETGFAHRTSLVGTGGGR